MFHLAGVDKRAFLDGIRADPQTYGSWSTGEWQIETSGKEDAMFSPFLAKPFAQAIRDGVMPGHLHTIGGTWGAMHDTGELTYMNLVHLAGCDGTDPDSMTRSEMEGRRQAMSAIEALRRYTPGCAGARLRNFGMTIGIRDTRKIEAVYALTEADVRNEARFEDSIGIYPEFIDGYGVLILPTTGRYMQIPYRSLLPRGVENLLVVGPRYRRRPDRACGDAQHGLLRRDGPGRRGRRRRRDHVRPAIAPGRSGCRARRADPPGCPGKLAVRGFGLSGEGFSSPPPSRREPLSQLQQKTHEGLTLGYIERSQRFGRDQQGARRETIDDVASGFGQVDEAPPAIFRMGPGFHKAANHQAVDHALDGGTIHDGVAAEQVLRQRSSLSELRQGRPLGRRDVAIDPAREDRGMSLRDLAQDEANLILEDVIGNTGGPFGDNAIHGTVVSH